MFILGHFLNQCNYKYENNSTLNSQYDYQNYNGNHIVINKFVLSSSFGHIVRIELVPGGMLQLLITPYNYSVLSIYTTLKYWKVHKNQS